MSSPADYQSLTAATKGGCGCTGGRRHRRKHSMKRGGVGAIDDALFAVGTSYAAKRFGQKKRLGGRHTRRHRRGAGVVDDALVAGTALGLAHYFTKKGKKGGARRRVLPRRLTRKALV